MNPGAPAYTYRAEIVSVYDGDTVTVDIDCGFDIWRMGVKLRLYGIDTPEIRGVERPEGLIAKQFVCDLLPVGERVIVQTFRDKTGKFGRLLATIWTDDHGKSVNRRLLEGGFADPYLMTEGQLL
jgi:micrococcal nuclease